MVCAGAGSYADNVITVLQAGVISLDLEKKKSFQITKKNVPSNVVVCSTELKLAVLKS